MKYNEMAGIIVIAVLGVLFSLFFNIEKNTFQFLVIFTLLMIVASTVLLTVTLRAYFLFKTFVIFFFFEWEKVLGGGRGLKREDRGHGRLGYGKREVLRFKAFNSLLSLRATFWERGNPFFFSSFRRKPESTIALLAR